MGYYAKQSDKHTDLLSNIQLICLEYVIHVS